MTDLNGWIPAIAIATVGVWMNLCIWALNKPNPPLPFRLLFPLWNGLKGALGIHRLNTWLARRAS